MTIENPIRHPYEIPTNFPLKPSKNPIAESTYGLGQASSQYEQEQFPTLV